MKKRTKRRAFLVPGVILFGIAIMVILITSRKPPQQTERKPTGALVEVIEASRTDQPVIVTSHGEVSALYNVSVTPQVGGEVVWVSPKLVAGGEFAKGETMLRVDPQDYELRVEQARAQVAAAEYQQQVAEANAEIARDEWEMVQNDRGLRGGDRSGQPDPLVLHEPQLKQAQSNLQSARATLDQAKLNLRRTEIRAPFNARVRSKNVSPGQLVGPGAPVAQIYSTDVAEIEVTMPVADLAYLEIPGSRADVVFQTGSRDYHYNGYLDRQVGVLGQTGRLARVIVRVDDPFSTDDPDLIPLILGAFVEVDLHGREAEDVVVVPRAALRENDQVWVATEDSTLSIRNVDIHYRNRGNVLVRRGLEDGDLIILTPISAAAEGMKLRTTLSDQPTESSTMPGGRISGGSVRDDSSANGGPAS